MGALPIDVMGKDTSFGWWCAHGNGRLKKNNCRGIKRWFCQKVLKKELPKHWPVTFCYSLQLGVGSIKLYLTCLFESFGNSFLFLFNIALDILTQLHERFSVRASAEGGVL